jgi:hypothetical protein
LLSQPTTTLKLNNRASTANFFMGHLFSFRNGAGLQDHPARLLYGI